MYFFITDFSKNKYSVTKGEISMNKGEEKIPVLKTNLYGFESSGDVLFVGIGLLLLCLFLFGGLF